MSATFSLEVPVAAHQPPLGKRHINATTSLVQLGLLIAGLLLALVFFNAVAGQLPASETVTVKLKVPHYVVDADGDFPDEPSDTPANVVEALTPHMRGALNYVTRRYRVSQKALLPIFEAAQITGRQRGIDPLLIVAVIGIESGFNPLAESSMGAQGLMQVIPRFHQDKVPEGAGDSPLLDPVTNVQVGVHVLQESIRRSGGLIAGLQQYGGSSDTEDAYASKVLAEKRRLEQVVRRPTVVAGL